MKTYPKNLYKHVQRFADVTKLMIIRGEVNRAKRCLAVAEESFIKGSSEIKNVIANVYVHSLSSFMELHHCNIKDLFPKNLLNEYQQQIKASSI